MTRILLVEDHEEIWDFLSRRLRRRGYDVVVATDGQVGVDKACAERPDIVLLDMNLPVMDGWTVAGEIKKDYAACEDAHHRPDRARHVRRPRQSHRCQLRRLPRQACRLLPPAWPDRDADRQCARCHCGLKRASLVVWNGRLSGRGCWAPCPFRGYFHSRTCLSGQLRAGTLLRLTGASRAYPQPATFLMCKEGSACLAVIRLAAVHLLQQFVNGQTGRCRKPVSEPSPASRGASLAGAPWSVRVSSAAGFSTSDGAVPASSLLSLAIVELL